MVIFHSFDFSGLDPVRRLAIGWLTRKSMREIPLNSFVFNAPIIFLTLEVPLWYTPTWKFPFLSRSLAPRILSLP